MLVFFYKIKPGLTSPVLHLFSPLTIGEISAFSGTPYHNTSNYLLVLQHLKTASPSFTMARIAIFGTCKGQIHLLPHYPVCFALVTAL